MRVREMNRFPFSINPNNSRRNLFIYYYLDFGRRPTLHTFSEYVDYIASTSTSHTRAYIERAHTHFAHETRHSWTEKTCDPTNSIFQLCVNFYVQYFFLLAFSLLLAVHIEWDSPRRCYHYAMLCQHLLSVFHLKTMLFSLQKCVETMRWRETFDPAVFHWGSGMNGAHEKMLKIIY